MLQYILTESKRYSVAELAQMAIEGGCMWISLHLPGLDDAAVRDLVAPDVVDMCREASVFLTVDDRPGLARELGLHGVRISSEYLRCNAGVSAMSLRDELGPEAVIGLECADASVVPALVAADIDFVTLPADFDSTKRGCFTAAIRGAGVQMPVVAQGDFTADEAREAMADGCNGVAVGLSITDAPDPIVAMQTMLAALGA